MKLSPWSILGIDQSSTLEQARAAYYEHVKWWHPDMNPHLPKDRANTRMAQLNAAWAEIQQILKRVEGSRIRYSTEDFSGFTSDPFMEAFRRAQRASRTKNQQRPRPTPQWNNGQWVETSTGGFRRMVSSETFTIYKRTIKAVNQSFWAIRIDRAGQDRPEYVRQHFSTAQEARDWVEAHIVQRSR